jgi:energy-coupling factor transporter ATP-binding protein EcfA2
VISVLIFTTISAVLKSRRLFGIIPLTELNRHVVILGPTGSGKTTIAKRIVEMAAKRDVRVTILDWKGEYTNYVKNAVVVRKVNIWDNEGRTPTEKAVIAVEMLREITRDIADMSSASATLLLKELVRLYSEKGIPTTKDVMDRIDRFMQTALSERRLAEANMAAAILRRLYWLQIDEERTDENIHGSPDVVIYDLSSTGSNYLKTLYSLAILSRKYYEALRRGPTDELVEVIIAEECQNYVRGRRPDEPPSIGERVTYELRSFGVGTILVCPDPMLLPEAIAKDVGAVVSMSPDAVPRFALERYLFRASLEEAERTLEKLRKARMIIYHRGRLHYLRRLPKPPKELRLRPKGDRMGVTHPWAGGRSLRAWPILPRRSPGRPTTEVKKEDIEERPRPKIVEVKVVEEKAEAKPEVVEVKPKAAEEPLRLEEEEEEFEESGTITTEPTEEPAVKVKEVEGEIKEPEPAPKGPPIPSALPYRGSLCPAGRPHLTPVH